MPRDALQDRPKSAIVVGGGFGGVAAALRLRARGFAVTIVDRCPRLGGRAQTFELDGFRHDAGPTVITAPFLFEELFQLFDRRMEDYVRLAPLDPWYRFRFADGDTLDYGPTDERTRAEIARIAPDDVAGFDAFAAQSKRIYDIGFERLADRPFHDPIAMLAQAPNLLRLRAYDSVWEMVSRHFSNDKIRRAFSIQPLLVGGNPFSTTSVYGLINHLERAHGIWFAMGGTGALVDALERLMREVGVEIRLNVTVDQIFVRDEQARGVVLEDGKHLYSDIVVSNVDPGHLYRSMLPRSHWTASLRRKYAKPSMGLFVLYFGARRQYSDVAHHTIWFGDRYRELLQDIFERHVLADDFSLYVHRPTATDPSFAPSGCDSFYVLCPAPNLRAAVDWRNEAPKLRDRIVDALDRTLLPGLKETICAEFYMTPEDFKDDYLSVDGAGFSIAPIFTQSAWFRYHNRAEGVHNLFLVGAGTHPGAGLPGVVSSAKVLDRLLDASEATA